MAAGNVRKQTTSQRNRRWCKREVEHAIVAASAENGLTRSASYFPRFIYRVDGACRLQSELHHTGDSRLHLFQTAFSDVGGWLLPVVAIEELEAEYTAEATGQEGAQNHI